MTIGIDFFPIELVDHNPEWKNIYKKEKQRILSKVGKEKNNTNRTFW